ncbi:MAG: phosphodiester glycosidase family protein, partial [Nitriliruptoraceae bacterium]
RRRVAVLLLAGLILTLLPGLPAAAVEVRSAGAERLLGQTSLEGLDIRLADGRRVRGHLLRFRANDPAVRLEPRLARGTALGVETLPSLVQRELPRGAVAAWNGGYFLAARGGVPNGLFVDQGRLVTGDSISRGGLPVGRAVLGLREDGQLVTDRLSVQLTIQAPWLALPPITLTDLNRPIRTTDPLRGADAPWGEVMLYTSAYGGDVTAPALSTVLILDDVALPSRGQVETTVRERFVPSVDRTFSIPEGTQLLVAHGSRAEELRPVTVGTLLSVAVEITPFLSAPEAWDGLRAALPGGGLLLKDGQVSSGTTLASEALDHASSRRARTAVGWTPAGQVLLLTVDETLGSRGLTLFETALVFRELGAIDAVALDGGGSTHLMIDGVTYNRPSGPGRGHSSALVLYTEPPPPARDLVSACPQGVALPGGFADTGRNVHASAIDCLAWWGITRGVEPGRYLPSRGVTRAEMATFLARWLDDAASRGRGVALPDTSDLPFTDVEQGSTHAPAIARLSAAGIIAGQTATTFDPGATVNRGQTASLVRRALEYATGQALPGARDTFIDDNDLVHEASIDQLAAAGIVAGTGGFSVQPGDPVRRDAMASLLMRSSALLVDGGTVAPPV